jgi:fructose-specific phosphotransferase system IIC component
MKTSLAYLMLDGPLSLRDTFVVPALGAGIVCLAVCAVCATVARKRKKPIPYWLRALSASAIALLVFAIAGIFLLPDRPLL